MRWTDEGSSMRALPLTLLAVLLGSAPLVAQAETEVEASPASAPDALVTEPETATESPGPSAEAPATPETSAMPAQADTPAAEPEEVLVTGEQPGPGLWRISKDDHVLWILGTHGPLPKDMTWRSTHVAARVAESQELLLPPEVKPKVGLGFFKLITLIPSAMKVSKNPDGKELKDILSPELHARWTELKNKYIGPKKDMEDLRPTVAVLQLYSEAEKKVGLGFRGDVWSVINKTAKKNKLRTTPSIVEYKLEVKAGETRSVLKKFARTPLADMECFDRSLASVESRLEKSKMLANAWAVGNIDAFRNLPPVDGSEDCAANIINALFNSGELAEELGATELTQNFMRTYREMTHRANDTWLAAAGTALERNAYTFAALPIATPEGTLFNPDSLIEQLKAKGYEVREP